MEKKKRLTILTIIVFLAFALSTGPVMAAQKVIKVGVVGPLTGQFAAAGQSQLTGAEMKAKEINAAGGPYRIELVSEDDASKCDQTVNATVKLINQDKVVAVLGAVNSPCSLAMVPITKRYKTPQFTLSIGTAITQQGSKWVFRVNAGAPMQSKALAEYAVKVLGHKKLAILYSDDEYGASAMESFVKALDSMGMKAVAVESYPREDKDFTGQLIKIKNSGATVLFPTGSYQASALICRQAKQLGMNLQILGDTGNASPKFIELGGDAVEGAIIVEPFTITDPDPKVQEFAKKYEALYNRKADAWVAELYDSMGMVHEAVVKTGKIDRQAIRDYIAGMKKGSGYKGILGDWAFADTGDGLLDLYKVKIRGGKKTFLAK